MQLVRKRVEESQSGWLLEEARKSKWLPISVCNCGAVRIHPECIICGYIWCPKNKEEIRTDCPKCSARDIDGLEDEPLDIDNRKQCPSCKKWFKTQGILDYHRNNTPCQI
jgi:hypothetical protein